MAKQTDKTKKSPKLFTPLTVGIVIGAVAGGTAVLVWPHEPPARTPPLYRAAVQPRSEVPSATLDAHTLPTLALDPAVVRVASRFVCSCGSCGEKRLEVCDCDTAKRERAFIQEQLRNGRSEAEAAEALNQKYGGLKPGRS